MIIRSALELVQTGLTKAIGEPEDYNKNLERGNFPPNTNIKLPEETRDSGLDDLGEIEDALVGIEQS